MKNGLLSMVTISLLLLAGCSDSGQTPEATSSVQSGERGESLAAIAHDAFIYAYPMMEQVKTVNGMFEFMGVSIPRQSRGLYVVSRSKRLNGIAARSLAPPKGGQNYTRFS